MNTIDGINSIKNDPKGMFSLFRDRSNKEISAFLTKIGKLSPDLNPEPFLYLLKEKKITNSLKVMVVKNLGKLSHTSLTEEYKKIIESEKIADLRREAVSALGRQRNEENIDYFFSLLNDRDPEVVLQSIRALLVFRKKEGALPEELNNASSQLLVSRGENKVVLELKKLRGHENELISEVIEKELFSLDEKHIKEDHADSPSFMKNLVVEGDVRETLKKVPDESIHLTFTSPPYYNARDYSTYSSYDEYLNFLEEAFKEVHRITKEGRFFLLNSSPIIIPRVSRSYSSKRYPIPYDIHHRLVDQGWEFIDDIVWVKPAASVKNRIGGFMQHRTPLAYKPNAINESVMVYRKKTNKLIDWNLEQYPKEIIEESKIKGNDYDRTNVWHIDPVFDKKHSAVFPLELCNRVVKYYSLKKDLVFDPFAGSGTFGMSALLNERSFFLTEKSPEYVKRIKENLHSLKNLHNFNQKISFIKTKDFKQKELK